MRHRPDGASSPLHDDTTPKAGAGPSSGPGACAGVRQRLTPLARRNFAGSTAVP